MPSALALAEIARLAEEFEAKAALLTPNDARALHALRALVGAYYHWKTTVAHARLEAKEARRKQARERIAASKRTSG